MSFTATSKRVDPQSSSAAPRVRLAAWRKFVRDAEEYGSMFGAPGYVQEKIDPVVSTLDQLAPFYFES